MWLSVVQANDLIGHVKTNIIDNRSHATNVTFFCSSRRFERACENYTNGKNILLRETKYLELDQIVMLRFVNNHSLPPFQEDLQINEWSRSVHFGEDSQHRATNRITICESLKKSEPLSGTYRRRPTRWCWPAFQVTNRPRAHSMWPRSKKTIVHLSKINHEDDKCDPNKKYS